MIRKPGAQSRLRAILAVALAFWVSAVVVLAQIEEEDYTLIASVDGTQLVTASDYVNGVHDGSNNITKCSTYNDRKGRFVLRVVMGDFTDYIIPTSADTTVCDVLTSRSADGKYRWSANDPVSDQWDGYSEPVGLASYWEHGLGGAPMNFLPNSAAAGRSTIAFWGFDDEPIFTDSDDGADGADGVARLGHKGGCCAHVAHESPAWYQSFKIYISREMDEEALYLVLASKPTAVVLQAPVVFMAKIWNFRGEPLSAKPTFTVNLNGMKTETQTAMNNRATLVFESDLSASDFASLTTEQTFALTISTSATDKLSSQRASLSLSLPVLPSFANVSAMLQPCRSTTGVAKMLHFGPADFAIAPVSRFSAFDNDWFAAASLSTSGAAGESFLRPVEGHSGVAQADPALQPTTQAWTSVVSSDDDGAFAGHYSLGSTTAQDKAANGTLQFYAFTLYSAADQEVVLQITVSEAFAFLVDHTEVEPPAAASTEFTESNGATTKRITFSYYLSQGYHPVLVKLFSSQAKSGNKVYAKLNFKLFGTGVAYALETPLEIPDGAYEMTSDSYMYYLLNNGESATDMLYADTIDQDLIHVHTATPRVGSFVVAEDQRKSESDINAQRKWSSVVFYGGNIAIDGSNIPQGRNYAVKYVALALYNKYDNDVEVSWQLVVKGHTEMYMDGVLQYSASSETEEEEWVSTALTPGWHQLIVRLATPRDRTWIFRFYMYFFNYRLIGSLQVRQTYSMPFGLRAIDDGVRLQAMLELTAKDLAVTSDKFAAMIAYDASNETESAVTFLHPGLSLARISEGVTKHENFYAYGTETISLSTTNSNGLVRDFEWVPTTKLQDAVWGHVDEDKLAGGYYRLWAVSLYAAESTTMKADVDFVGGWAMWVDSKLGGSVQPTEENKGVLGEKRVTTPLTKGWHQVVLKLQVPSTFKLGKTKDSYGTGWETWLDVSNVCKNKYSSTYRMCASQAYCPFDAPRVGADLPLTPKNATNSPNIYAPVLDAENMFIQLAEAVEGVEANLPQPICSNANITVVSGNNLSDYGAGKFIGCCESIRTPFIAVTFNVPSGSAGKMGYTYHELVSIATPKITRSAAYLGRQTVTIQSETADAGIRYRTADDGDWVEYTGSFNITSTTMVQAQAYLGSRTSGTVSVELNVPEVITYDRTECLYDKPCPLTFTGANLGNLASLVSRNQPPKTVQSYANLSFSGELQQSNIFSGVQEMDDDTLTANLRVSTPSDSAVDVAQYVVMVYNERNGTQEGYLDMRRSLSLKPKTVAADSEALFMADTYFHESDTVLFPQLHKAVDDKGNPLHSYLAETECTVAVCKTAMMTYASAHGSPVTAVRTFEANLGGTTRSTLTCLCACLGCRERLASGAMTTTFVGKPDRITALPINITVVSSHCEDGQHPPSKAEKDVGSLVFVIVLPILVVLAVVTIGLLVYCRARKRKALAQRLNSGTTTVMDITDQENTANAHNDNDGSGSRFSSPAKGMQPDYVEYGSDVSPMSAARHGYSGGGNSKVGGGTMSEVAGAPFPEGLPTAKSAPSYPDTPLTRQQ